MQELLTRIRNGDFISLDTETISLTDLTLVSFSFCVDGEAYFIPVNMNTTDNFKNSDVSNILQALMEKENLIFHNWSFDARVLKQHGFTYKHKPHDTLLISHLLDENSSHRLKDLVRVHFEYDMTTLKEIIGTGKKQISFADVNEQSAVQYGSDDALFTYKLFKKLYPRIQQNEDLLNCYEQIERPLLQVVFHMHDTGVPVDIEKVREIQALCQLKADEYYDKLQYYMKEVNLNSPKQLRDYFIDQKFAPILKRSRRTGEPSVDVEVLENYSSRFVEAGWILKYRYYTKILTTFIPALTPQTDDRIFPHFNQVGTTSGRFSSSAPNCFSLDTEVLTPMGWKKHSEIAVGDSVYQWNNDKVELTEVINKYRGIQKGLRFHNRHIDICASENHRQLFQDRKTKEIKIRTMDNFLKDAYILHGGKLEADGYVPYDEWVMKFNVAVQADGSINKYCIDFCFTKKRKSDRLLEILKNLGINFVDASTKARYRYYVYGKELLVYLNTDKTFNINCIELGKDFIEELFYWDGSYTRRNNYASKEEHNIDIVQAAAALTGEYRTYKRVYRNKMGSISYQLDITRRNNSLTSSNAKKSIGTFTKIDNLHVWAISVPSSFIICRRNGKVVVTGNCQNIPSNDKLGIRDCIKAPSGYKLIGADYSQMELRLAAHFSQDPNLLRIYRTNGDIHSETSNAVGCDRRQAKIINFGILYGIGVKSLAKNLESTRNDAYQYIKKYYENYPRLREWIRESKFEAVDKGYLVLWGGRHRNISINFEDKTEWEKGGELRSMVNAIIQGSGANIVKKAMVLMHPFLEKFGAKLIVQVHDEVIVLCPNKHVDEVTRIIHESMIAPTKGLSVPFTVEIKSGKTWGEIH